MNFFQGRYGFDMLSKLILLSALPFLMFRYTLCLGAGMAIYALWRATSRDITARSNEAIRFENWLRNKLGSFQGNKGYGNYYGQKNKFSFDNLKANIEEKRKYKILKCPKCGQKLRLPRGKGKVVVTCKKCLNEFRAKS